MITPLEQWVLLLRDFELLELSVESVDRFHALMSCTQDHLHLGHNCIPSNIILGEE
jgi:hypothetical protein